MTPAEGPPRENSFPLLKFGPNRGGADYFWCPNKNHKRIQNELKNAEFCGFGESKENISHVRKLKHKGLCINLTRDPVERRSRLWRRARAIKLNVKMEYYRLELLKPFNAFSFLNFPSAAASH